MHEPVAPVRLLLSEDIKEPKPKMNVVAGMTVLSLVSRTPRNNSIPCGRERASAETADFRNRSQKRPSVRALLSNPRFCRQSRWVSGCALGRARMTHTRIYLTHTKRPSRRLPTPTYAYAYAYAYASEAVLAGGPLRVHEAATRVRDLEWPS
jgi:hypothetical protein